MALVSRSSAGFIIGLILGWVGLSSHPTPSWAVRTSAGTAGPAELERFLGLDRFHYYLQHLSRIIEKRGRPDVGKALRSIEPAQIASLRGADSRILTVDAYDSLAVSLLRETHGELHFADSEVAWNYPFFKNKLQESFKLAPATLGTRDQGDTSEFLAVPEGDLPSVDPAITEAESTLDVGEYSAWKTTRGVFWEAAKNHRTFEFHMGSYREFSDRVTARGGKITGEVRALARNYNRIFVIQYPGEEGFKYAVTLISGRDRLQHLMQQSVLLGWRSGAGTSLSEINLAVYGSPVALRAEQTARFTSVYRSLPKADRVIIGQRDGIKKMIRSGLIAQRVLEIRHQDRARFDSAGLTPEELRVVVKFAADKAAIQIAYRENKSWDAIAAKLRIDGSNAAVFETELDLGSHDLSDFVVKTRSDQTERWRLISNTWGDEIVPIALALKTTGHKDILYIGTAGALPGSGLVVGDLVVPRGIHDTQGNVRTLPSNLELPAQAKLIDVVAHVKSPFQETQAWLRAVHGHAQAVELETAYLAEVFSEPSDGVRIYLLVSDVVGSEAETLAQSGTASSRATTRKRLLEHLLGKTLAVKSVIDPTTLPAQGAMGFTETFLNWVRKAAPARDPVSQYQAARRARMLSVVSESQVAAFVSEEPAFSAAFLERKLLESGKVVAELRAALMSEGISTQLVLPRQGILDGTWNPKNSPVVAFLTSTSPGDFDSRIETRIRAFYDDKPVLRKLIQLKRAPEVGSGLVPVSRLIPDDFKSLLEVYKRTALELGGLVTRETRSGGLDFTITARMREPVQWPLLTSPLSSSPNDEESVLSQCLETALIGF